MPKAKAIKQTETIDEVMPTKTKSRKAATKTPVDKNMEPSTRNKKQSTKKEVVTVEAELAVNKPKGKGKAKPNIEGKENGVVPDMDIGEEPLEKAKPRLRAPSKVRQPALPKTNTKASNKEVKPKSTRSKAAATSESKETPEEPKKKAVRGTKRVKPEEEVVPKKKGSGSNKSSTDWDTVDFSCPTKNASGKTSNFHITSWNVGGLRSCVAKGGLALLQHDQPDILCLQETKCTDEDLPQEIINNDIYKKYWYSSEKKGYAGVGILSKVMPIEVNYGIGKEESDNKGRCITAEFKYFYLVNVYVPNAGRKLVTLPKRLEWNEKFKAYINTLNKKKPVVVCGDMNVAHLEIDLANPKSNKKSAGFTQEERDGMTDFLSDGLVDTFRKLYPEKEKAYTFWTFLSNSRAKNVGWRLDYFIVADNLLDNVCDNIIHSEVYGSDHCPISLHLNI